MKKRVKIPARDAKMLLDLVSKVRAKHEQDGEESPLKVLKWNELNAVIDEAIQTEESAKSHNRMKLSLYQKRSQSLEAVAEIVRSSRDILAGVHRNQMKVLGLWGFDVMDSKVTLPDEIESQASVITK